MFHWFGPHRRACPAPACWRRCACDRAQNCSSFWYWRRSIWARWWPACALWLTAILHAVDVTRTLRRGAALWGALALACAVTFQAALGILTLLEQAPLAIAL